MFKWIHHQRLNFNQVVLYGRDSTVDQIVETAKRYPMMSEYQVVIVKEAQNIKDIDELIHYANAPLKSTLLVINYKYKTLDKRKKLYKVINENSVSFYRISALDSSLVSGLKELISKNLKLSSQSNIIITNSRHLEALNNSLKAIESVNKGLKEGLSGDLLSIDLNDAIINISIITGKIDIDQDILGSIFSKFCIGK